MNKPARKANAVNPTAITYEGLNGAYDFFNVALFDNTLPRCLITLQRKSGSHGYWAGERFGSRDGTEKHDEIALNPATFKDRTVEDILSTLVHEQVHLWQAHFGTLPRRAYHDKQWAEKMIEIGLQPTDTGLPGGKITGQKMTHRIIEGGLFAQACAALIANGWTLPYIDLWGGNGEQVKVAAKKRASKTKFSCPGCGANAWGKPDLRIICGDCDEEMIGENSAAAHFNVQGMASHGTAADTAPSVTPGEAQMLRNIVLNLFQPCNGAEPPTFEDCDRVWSNCLSEGNGPHDIPARSIPGLVASLVKKGLAGSDGECVWVTRAGYAVYKSLPTADAI